MAKKSVGHIVGIITLILCCNCLCISSYFAYTANGIYTKKTKATVTETTCAKIPTTDTTRCTSKIKYTVDGKQYESKIISEYNYQKNRQISIEYDPSEPTTFRIDSNFNEIVAVSLNCSGCIALCIAIGISLY